MTDDIQKLLRRGVSPQLIAALVAKGAAYVHVMATGSDEQLRRVTLRQEQKRR